MITETANEISAIDDDAIREMVEIALDNDVESFDMNANFYEVYGLDSMGAVVFFVELERRTKIEVREQEALDLNTGSKVLAYINRRRSFN